MPKRSRKPRASGKSKLTEADQQLVKALAHPVRAEALMIFNAGVSSPNRIADELGLNVNLVAYHVRVLDELGCIELVNTEQRRGATEHFYRGVGQQYLSDDFWAKLSDPVRSGISVTALRILIGAVRASVAARLFDRRKDRHASVVTYTLDEQGWREANGELNDALKRIMEIGVESEGRIIESGDDQTIRATFGLLGFESTPATPPKDG